jgi:hypothetical protein
VETEPDQETTRDEQRNDVLVQLEENGSCKQKRCKQEIICWERKRERYEKITDSLPGLFDEADNKEELKTWLSNVFVGM